MNYFNDKTLILCLHLYISCCVLRAVSVTLCGTPGRPAKSLAFPTRRIYREYDIVMYRCTYGYQLIGNNQRVCQGGRWNGQLPLCLKVVQIGADNWKNFIRINDTMTKLFDGRPDTCIPTFESDWLSWKIRLVKAYYIIKIHVLPSQGFDLQLYYPNDDHYSNPREVIEFRDLVVNGHPLSRTARFICEIRIHVSELISSCGEPEIPMNSYVEIALDKKTALYNCISGYKPVGSTVTHCQVNGRWRKSDMKCIPMEVKRTNASKLQVDLIHSWSIVFIAIYVIVGFLLFGLIMYLGKKVYQKLKNFAGTYDRKFCGEMVNFHTPKVYHSQRQRQEGEAIMDELLQMHQIAPTAISENVSLEEQVELLPYDQHLEFPKKNLILGKTLGKGAFGRVVRAEAIGLKADETTTVVVKMIKGPAKTEALKALVSEVKILSYVGYHLNIVNPFGAVTKDILKGELMAIVEYCHFGNLRNHLMRQWTGLMNLVDPKIERIQMNYFSYLYRLPSIGKKSLSRKHSGGIRRRRDDPYDVPTVTITDLTYYAFQCAKGMEFLESRNLVHGDLCARNVLLAKDRVVKIRCNFGRPNRFCYKSIQKKEKAFKEPLPVKWMAPESIFNNVFTTKSDVWSFGILLWEMFTLGANPYPGVCSVDELLEVLKQGHLMEKPEYAPDVIYYIMKQTWRSDPKQRPDFFELAESFENLLNDNDKQHYLDVKKQYSKEWIQMKSEMKRNFDRRNTTCGDSVVS